MISIRYFIAWAAWFVVRHEPDSPAFERIDGPFQSEVDAVAALQRLAAVDAASAG